MSSRGVNLPLTERTCKLKNSRVATPRGIGVFSVVMATRDVTPFLMFYISRGSIFFIPGIVSNTASVEIIEWSGT